MKMRDILVACAAGIVLTGGARDTAIYNGKLTGAMNANGFGITNAAAPVGANDLATKQYVDSVTGVTPSVVTSVANYRISKEVADWARSGQPQPTGSVTDVQTNGVSAVVNGVANIVLTAGVAQTNYYQTVSGISIYEQHDGQKLIKIEKQTGGTNEYAYLANDSFSIFNVNPNDMNLTKYESGRIFTITESHLCERILPSASGTLALTSDIPSYFAPYATNATAKIQASDIASGVIPTVPANIVTYTAGSPSTSSAILSSANATAENISSQKVANVSAIVATWENFLDGSNVVFSITNYISGAYSTDYAKLRILEMRNGAYSEVYNSHTEITNHIGKFKSGDFKTATNAIVTATNNQLANKADKAWGQYTSAGGEAPSNTVYMTAPNTVFAGGMEYERVAVGEGAVCVLTTKGAPVWTSGDEGTFKFQDDGGTNYFGFAKTDSYTIGCDTDAISVQNHIVSLTYNVTMSGVPCIWYKADIGNTNAWEKLNLPDGTAVPGASHSVNWDQSPAAGTEVCYINCPEAKGFFKASIEVTGSAKFMTNMPADFGGGILCTDGIHKVKINWNNGSPTFVEVQ